jgi:hypothetical protein
MTHPIPVTGAAGRVSRLVRPEFLVVIEIVAAKA